MPSLKHTRYGVLATVVLLVGSGYSPARGGFIPVVNAGFENPVVGEGLSSSGAVPGWVRLGTSFTIINPTAVMFSGQAPEGENIAELAGASSLTQTLSATLDVNTTYTLTAQVGDRTLLTFAGYSVELLAGGTVIASSTDAFVPANGTFSLATVTYTTGVADPHLGTTLGIRLRATDATFSGLRRTYFDDVKLFADTPGTPNPVPAPAGLVLVASAGGFLGLVRLRRIVGRK